MPLRSRSSARSRLRHPGWLVALALVLAACAGPPVDPGFGAGEVARGASASLQALDGAFDGRVDLTFALEADPSAEHPLPAGVSVTGPAVRLAATPTLARMRSSQASRV